MGSVPGFSRCVAGALGRGSGAERERSKGEAGRSRFRVWRTDAAVLYYTGWVGGKRLRSVDPVWTVKRNSEVLVYADDDFLSPERSPLVWTPHLLVYCLCHDYLFAALKCCSELQHLRKTYMYIYVIICVLIGLAPWDAASNFQGVLNSRRRKLWPKRM